MIRPLLLLLLGLAAVALVRGVLGDFRRRRQTALIERLRASFVHGAPLAPPVRLVGLQEIRYQGLDLRLPGSWRFEPQAERLLGAIDVDGQVTLQLEHAGSDVGLGSSGTPAATVVGESSSRWRITKDVELVRRGDDLLAVYTWRVALATGEVRLRLSMPAAAATSVLRQSDVTAVERALAEATTTTAAAAPDLSA